MLIKELKEAIENDTLDLSSTQVWKLSDDTSTIIAEQYIHIIAEKRGLEVKYIDSFKGIDSSPFVEDTNLYVMKEGELGRIQQHNNCIILCKSTKIKNVVSIPKLEEWQVINYACSLANGLKPVELEWLITQYNGNYMAFLSDVSKLKAIPTVQQQMVYEQMLEEGQFNDHTSLNIWDLTNGIIKRDRSVVNEALKVINAMDVEPLGLLTTLYRGFKNVINIQLDPKATAESTGLSSKQFYAISKNNCGHYTKDELIKIFKFLTDIEYQFKFGSLDVSNIIDYLIVNIMGV